MQQPQINPGRSPSVTIIQKCIFDSNEKSIKTAAVFQKPVTELFRRVKTRCLYSTLAADQRSFYHRSGHFPQDDRRDLQVWDVFQNCISGSYTMVTQTVSAKSILATFQTISHLRSNMLAVQNRASRGKEKSGDRYVFAFGISIFIVWRFNMIRSTIIAAKAAYVQIFKQL